MVKHARDHCFIGGIGVGQGRVSRQGGRVELGPFIGKNQYRLR